VNNFVFLYGQKISDIWRTYLDQYKWSTFEEPRDVKPVHLIRLSQISHVLIGNGQNI
jgi:hypothetical protein